jgi:two-component system nitrogen regulation response regulator GlnG
MLRERVEGASSVDCPVLIEGERGTGRELVARVLHAHSARRTAGFVRIDSEFYERHRLEEKLRRADGGSLLIKEVAQVGRDRYLVQFLRLGAKRSQGVPNVRVLAATGVDLGLAVDAGLFDAEVYERLGGLRIAIPPLRARPDDVPLFAEHFLRESCQELGREPLTFAQRALDKLKTYSWPGNVAELRDVVRRLSLRARSEAIELKDVEMVLPPVHETVPLEQLSFEDMVRSKLRALLQRMEGYPIKDLYDEVIGRVERPLIEEVLARTGGNQMRAAEMLGMNRNTLRKKMLEREVNIGNGKKK